MTLGDTARGANLMAAAASGNGHSKDMITVVEGDKVSSPVADGRIAVAGGGGGAVQEPKTKVVVPLVATIEVPEEIRELLEKYQGLQRRIASLEEMQVRSLQSFGLAVAKGALGHVGALQDSCRTIKQDLKSTEDEFERLKKTHPELAIWLFDLEMAATEKQRTATAEPVVPAPPSAEPPPTPAPAPLVDLKKYILTREQTLEISRKISGSFLEFLGNEEAKIGDVHLRDVWVRSEKKKWIRIGVELWEFVRHHEGKKIFKVLLVSDFIDGGQHLPFSYFLDEKSEYLEIEVWVCKRDSSKYSVYPAGRYSLPAEMLEGFNYGISLEIAADGREDKNDQKRADRDARRRAEEQARIADVLARVEDPHKFFPDDEVVTAANAFTGKAKGICPVHHGEGEDEVAMIIRVNGEGFGYIEAILPATLRRHPEIGVFVGEKPQSVKKFREHGFLRGIPEANKQYEFRQTVQTKITESGGFLVSSREKLKAALALTDAGGEDGEYAFVKDLNSLIFLRVGNVLNLLESMGSRMGRLKSHFDEDGKVKDLDLEDLPNEVRQELSIFWKGLSDEPIPDHLKEAPPTSVAGKTEGRKPAKKSTVKKKPKSEKAEKKD